MVPDEQWEMFPRFEQWRSFYEDKVVGKSMSSKNWQREVERIAVRSRYDRSAWGLHSIMRGLMAGKSLVPKWGFDKFCKTFFKMDASMIFVKVNMIGGEYPGLIPAKPFMDTKTTCSELRGEVCPRRQ